MGDPRRFDLFARLVARLHPDRNLAIADVASGKGYLQAALRQLGYVNVTSWDKRKRNAKNRRGYRYGLFDHRDAPDYGLVLAMHPDEATDQAICYAAARGRPFVVVPCCVKPSAVTYWGEHKFAPWLEHLARLAVDGGMSVAWDELSMNGRSVVLSGAPKIA